jgi:CheY-like chemotaxis protein
MKSMIFVVDDDPIQNMLTTQLIKLNPQKTDYLVFNNGQEVLTELQNDVKPNIILLDINMPIMDGWAFLDAYQNFPNKAAVYMLTSSTNDADMQQAKNYYCVKGYYQKPLNLGIIAGILSQLDKD